MFIYLFWLSLIWTYAILVPQAGIKHAPPAVDVQSLNYWTARDVPSLSTFGLVSLWLPVH